MPFKICQLISSDLKFRVADNLTCPDFDSDINVDLVYGRNNLPVNLPTRSPRFAKLPHSRFPFLFFSGLSTAQSIIPPSNPLCGFQPLAQQQQALNGKQQIPMLSKSYS